MPYKTGNWGEQAKIRNKKRLEYFRNYSQKKWRIKSGKIGHGLGYLGEVEALNILNNGLRNNDRKGIDILWGNKTVEVKTSSYYNKPKGLKGWKFYTKKQVGKCDFFLFICKDRFKQTKHIFLIPSNEINKDDFHISVCNLILFSKYALKVR